MISQQKNFSLLVQTGISDQKGNSFFVGAKQSSEEELFDKELPFPHSETAKLVVTFALFCVLLTILKKTGSPEAQKTSNKTENIWKNLQGPKQIWLLGNIHQLWSPKDRLEKMTSWCLQYTPYFQIKVGPQRAVILIAPSAIKSLLASTDSGHFNKAKWYDLFIPFWKNGLVISKAEKWKNRRLLLSRAFTLKSFLGYMQIYNKESKVLLAELGKHFESSKEDGEGKQIDKLIWKSTLRVICETTMGTDIWKIEGIDQLTETLNTCKRLCMMRILHPWLAIEWVWKLHPESKVLQEGVEQLEEFTRKVIDIRRRAIRLKEASNYPKENDHENSLSGKAPFKSMIEEMLQAGLDEDALTEEAQTIITTGYETTATTIQFALFLLALHPHHQKICQEEVDIVLNDVSLCPNGDFTYNSLSSLKHLERCIQETLRLFPVANMIFRKLDSSLVIDGNLELPKGTSVGLFMTGVHRNPEIFKNPDEFNPYRFCLGGDKDEDQNDYEIGGNNNQGKMNQYAYLPFSAGKRNCIGFKFGLLEITVMVARILSKFNVKTTDTFKDVAIVPEIVLTPERGYKFLLEKRKVIT